MAVAALAALILAGCNTFGITPEQLEALKGDGACVGFVGSLMQPVYGTGGLGVVRLNSPGTISVSKDGTMTCTVK